MQTKVTTQVHAANEVHLQKKHLLKPQKPFSAKGIVLLA